MPISKKKQMIFGFSLLIIGLILTTLGGFLTKDAWAEFTSKNKTTHFDTLKSEKDIEAALMYQTQISLYFMKFKTCLHWSLPLKGNIDNEVDSIFNYGKKISDPINFKLLTPEICTKIFTSYNFKNVMPNYSGAKNFHPTGYNNLLGILSYLKIEIEKILFKYGSSISPELSTQIDYSIKMTESVISSIRLDVQTKDTTKKTSADIIANHLILLRDDFNEMKNKYTKDVRGGFPIMLGKINKVDKENGSMMVETQFSEY